MYDLPKEVVIGDTHYSITNDGDFRMVLDCFEALNDAEISEDSRVLASLLIFYNDFNSIYDIPRDENTFKELETEMFKFMNCGQIDEVASPQKPILVDWNKDSQMIMAGINNVAKQEIRALEYLHWWTFMGYYMSIGESTFSTVVGIRNKIIKGKKLEKYEKDFRNENPNYFEWNHKSAEDIEAEEWLQSMWNKY